MAYNTCERFETQSKPHRIFDPGAYQYTLGPALKPNKVPFLSKTERKTEVSRIWTHALYNSSYRSRIPNCSSILSKIPRFSYEAIDYDNIIDEILCQCGNDNPCECPIEGNTEEEKELCQAKVRRRIFKDHVPHSKLGEGLEKRTSRQEICPPFYDARVNESTAFYHGCKWSNRNSKRSFGVDETGPGPADYTLQHEPDITKICEEKVRAYKRKTSKQPRFIEMVQQLNIRENLPGPATYSPITPQRKDFHDNTIKTKNMLISKREYLEIRPGPADHFIRRDFDPQNDFFIPCRANLVSPAPFNVNAQRFKPRLEEGASPASYNTQFNPCKILKCSKAPFGSSSYRFKDTITDEEDSENEIKENKDSTDQETKPTKKMIPKVSWMFKSKCVRMKSSINLTSQCTSTYKHESKFSSERPIKLQNKCPFYTSDGKFRNWFNWVPVLGRDKIPGPAYYCLEKVKCANAVSRGPLYRSRRFSAYETQTPAPNQYKVCVAIEDILETCNEKLKHNIDKQHKFHWTQPLEPKKLTPQEQETKLLDESIEILSPDDVFSVTTKSKHKSLNLASTENTKRKLLRCFTKS